MNISIIYSSVTGNTEKLARGIQAIFSHHTHISPIEQAPLSHDADLYILGFWVRKGAPDSRMAKYMQTLHGKNVAYFGTLGAYPDSPHAQKVITAANTLLEGNTILGSFLCQGKIHPSLTGPLPSTPPDTSPNASPNALPDTSASSLASPSGVIHTNKKLRSSHPMTPERLARHKEAAKHPNTEDIQKAQNYFREVVERMEG